LAISSYFRKLREQKNKPTNNIVKKDYFRNVEFEYWIMTISVAILGGVVVILCVLNFIK